MAETNIEWTAYRGRDGDMSMHETGYLIHKSGRGWYCDKAEGYTLNSSKAGRFTRADAIQYSHPNGPRGPRDGITFKHESEILDGSSCEKDLLIHDLTMERDALRRGQEELSQALADAVAQIETLKARLRGAESAADITARLFGTHDDMPGVK